MDTDKAKNILNGGQTNSVKTPGVLVTDPRIVIQLYFDGSEYGTVFGTFETGVDILDYAVHRAKGVSLNEKESFYEDNSVEADIYTLSDSGEVNVARFVASADGWEEE